MNTIQIDPSEVQRQGFLWSVPREVADDSRFVKHVICEGARFHVISYDNKGARCSEPMCIINKSRDEL